VLELLFAVDEDLVCAALDLTLTRAPSTMVNELSSSVLHMRDVGKRGVVKHDLIIRRAPDHAGRARVKLKLRWRPLASVTFSWAMLIY